MNTDKDGGNAFPIPGLHEDPDFNGLSVRDYFAAKAMQAMIANANAVGFGDNHANNNATYAHVAYVMADAMLAERSKA